MLSGNSTEPTEYPEIAQVVRAVKNAHLQLSLFSNFHRGDRLLEVASLLTKDDVVRISLDASCDATYRLVHRPGNRHAFEKVRSNIIDLLQQRQRFRREFRVEISFVLMRHNCAHRELATLVSWARNVGVDRVRFTHLLCPKIGNEQFDNSQLLSERESTAAIAFVRNLQAEGTHSHCEIQILEDAPHQPQKPFRNCHHWKLIAVLGACGRFFPCTSVSLVRLTGRLGRGDINSPSFDFWQFWADPDKFPDLRPADCAAGRPAECIHFEFAVNQEIEQLAAATLTG